MREYSAISVSAADATSLANRLTEQAQQGWALVEIVNTNDQVVAYLERESDGAASASAAGGSAAGIGDLGTSDGWSSSPTPMGIPTSVGASATEVVTAVQDDAGNAAIVDQSTYSVGVPTADTGAASTPGWAAGATGAAAGYAAGATQSASDTASGMHDQASAAADSASDHAAATVSGSGITTGSGSTHDSGHHDSGHHDSGHHDSSGSSGHSDSDASSANADAGSGSSDGLAPAGWYGDPAGRFELRYWDGTQWTEHVASGSEQAIDPPIKGND